MSAKKDYCIVSKIIGDFIDGLTEEQFNNLLNGNADIKYVEKGIDSSIKEIYHLIMHRLISADSEEIIRDIIKNEDYLSNKQKIQDFCKFFKVEFRIKDSNEMLITNIIEFVKNNRGVLLYKYERQDSIDVKIEEIAKQLEEIMNVEEARELLKSKDILQNKTNLVKLAKKLRVFFDREAGVDTIIDTIVQSVVEAKIRSYTIRKKI